jgi:pyruvate formate lyase activating enzyme
MTDSPRAALLWEPLENGRCQCRLCSHFCIVEPGERGRCGVRENRDGGFVALSWERVAAVNVDPVEKKPLYHFLPGTRTFSFGTQGCNFRCSFCQNASLSQPPGQGAMPKGQRATPEQLVRAALDSGSRSISYTYSEPTVFFELMLETAKLAHASGLANVLVSNGFQSPQCLEALAPHMNAANIDLKAFTERFYEQQCEARLEPVLRTLKAIRAMGWWLEVTTLVIPGLNDDPGELAEAAAFIRSELGAETPWHLSKFHPQYRLLDRPATPVETLRRARKAGLEAGLAHVYLGNAPDEDEANTHCAGCGARLVTRHGFRLVESRLKEGRCPECDREAAGVWQ